MQIVANCECCGNSCQCAANSNFIFWNFLEIWGGIVLIYSWMWGCRTRRLGYRKHSFDLQLNLRIQNTQHHLHWYCTLQFSSVTQLCPTLCDPMNRSTPGLPVHQQLPEFTQTHVHRVSHAMQPSHPLSSPCPPALNPSQHQSLFQWVNSLHEVVKVLEFQL